MHKKFLLYTLLLMTPLMARAQQDVVDVSLDAAAMRVGEQVHLRLRVSCPSGAVVRFPEFPGDTLVTGVEVLDRSKVDTLPLNAGNRQILTREYTLTAFDSAVYRLPQIEVVINGRKVLSRNISALKVNTVPVDTAHPDKIRSPKGPVEAPFVWTTRVLSLCLLLWGMVAALLFLFVRLSDRRPVVRYLRIKAPTPPHKVAIEAIEALRLQEGRVADGQKSYFMKLTDVLRTYLFERFGFNAREMTSAEILRQLELSGDSAALSELREVLMTADLVKFARHEASLAESDRALLQAADYVRSTRPAVDPPAVRERVVVVGEVEQLRRRRFLQSGVAALLLGGFVLFCYIVYLLWSMLF